jgi:3-phosphoglycerate kinase
VSFRSIDDLQLTGKRVFVRVDFNVPLDEERNVTDDTRIREALPTLRRILQMGGKLIVASHLGRPKGVDPRLSLEPAARVLSELLGKPYEVLLADDCVGDGVRKMVKDQTPTQVVLLENLRFHKEEEANDPTFARELAENADVWVMDAFGTAHRAHASTAGMAPFVKERAAGYLMVKELEFLGRLLKSPAMPYVAVLGGAKVSDKIKVIENLLPRVSSLIVGGAMAYTFLKAQGIEVGKSRVEADKLDVARRALEAADRLGKPVVLPIDHIASTGQGADPQGEGTCASARADGPGHRAADPVAVRRAPAPGAHRALERADGAVRGAGVRSGNEGGGGDHRRPQGCDHRGGRRRQRGGGAGVRPGEEDVPRVDWRRRLPRVPRGQGAARCEGARILSRRRPS